MSLPDIERVTMEEGRAGRPFAVAHRAGCSDARGPEAPAELHDRAWVCAGCVPRHELPPLRAARGHGPSADPAAIALEFAATYTGERPFVLAMRERARTGAWTPNAEQTAALLTAKDAGG